MEEQLVVERDLELIGENLSVFTGKDRETEKMLQSMELSPDDVPEEVREKVEKVKGHLTNKKWSPKARIEKAEELLGELRRMRELPVSVKKMFVEEALRRLESAKKRAEWATSQRAAMESTLPISYSLELFLEDSKDVKKKLRSLGIKEVPEIVRDVAERARETMDNKSLTAKERALTAAEILMEPLQPAIYGKEEGMELQQEVKCVLWEISNDFVVEAQNSE